MLLSNPLDIVFTTDLRLVTAAPYMEDHITHALCEAGNGAFQMAGKQFEIKAGDFMILTDGKLVSDMYLSEDFEATVLLVSKVFIQNNRPDNNYDVIGVMSLFNNPIMPLTETEKQTCREDILLINKRLKDSNHAFHNELIGFLARAFFLDLYNIHYRIHKDNKISEKKSLLLRDFIALLGKDEYLVEREVKFFASKLAVSPKYLSNVSVQASGQPAQFWIDRFTITKIIQLIRSQQYSLTQIADMMNFSSLSYFSRYVQRLLGVTPSEYREKSR